MFDMLNMLGKVKDIQAKIQKTKEELSYITITAESENSLVKATVTGKRQVLSLIIDPQLLTPENSEKLALLTVNTINKALFELDQKIAAELKKSTEGLIPNIPGLDLQSLLGT